MLLCINCRYIILKCELLELSSKFRWKKGLYYSYASVNSILVVTCRKMRSSNLVVNSVVRRNKATVPNKLANFKGNAYANWKRWHSLLLYFFFFFFEKVIHHIVKISLKTLFTIAFSVLHLNQIVGLVWPLQFDFIYQKAFLLNNKLWILAESIFNFLSAVYYVCWWKGFTLGRRNLLSFT